MTTAAVWKIAGVLNAAAALAHIGCIIFGEKWYRFMGAGDHFVRMVVVGRWYPVIVTLLIASLLSIWSAYCLSAAGAIGHLPLRRIVLSLIAGIYLARAVGFPLLIPHFQGNTKVFWFWSSALSLLFGLIHLFGLWKDWSDLG